MVLEVEYYPAMALDKPYFLIEMGMIDYAGFKVHELVEFIIEA